MWLVFKGFPFKLGQFCRGRCCVGPAIAQVYSRMLNKSLLLVFLKAEASELSRWTYPTFWRRCSIIPGRWGFSWGKWMDSCAMAFSFHHGEDRITSLSIKRGWGPQDPRPNVFTPELAGMSVRKEFAISIPSMPCTSTGENSKSCSIEGLLWTRAKYGRKFLKNLTCASYTLVSEGLYLVLTWKIQRCEASWHCLWLQHEERGPTSHPDLAGKL